MANPAAAVPQEIYEKWLGISADRCPPNYYHLLGVELFEADVEKISQAAGQRIRLVRPKCLKHREIATQLLNEVAKAKVCLTRDDTRREYDEALRQNTVAYFETTRTGAWLQQAADEEELQLVPLPEELEAEGKESIRPAERVSAGPAALRAPRGESPFADPRSPAIDEEESGSALDGWAHELLERAERQVEEVSPSNPLVAVSNFVDCTLATAREFLMDNLYLVPASMGALFIILLGLMMTCRPAAEESTGSGLLAGNNPPMVRRPTLERSSDRPAWASASDQAAERTEAGDADAGPSSGDGETEANADDSFYRSNIARAAAASIAPAGVPPADDEPSPEPGEITGHLVDVMCRRRDVRLLICQETVGLDLELVEAVADDSSFREKIADYVAAQELAPIPQLAEHRIRDYEACCRGDRVTLRGEPVDSRDGWSAAIGCDAAIQLTSIQKAGFPDSLAVVGQPRAGTIEHAIVLQRNVIDRLLRSPPGAVFPYVRARWDISRPPRQGWLPICVDVSGRTSLLLNAPGDPDLVSGLHAGRVELELRFEGEWAEASPVLSCSGFRLSATPASAFPPLAAGSAPYGMSEGPMRPGQPGMIPGEMMVPPAPGTMPGQTSYEGMMGDAIMHAPRGETPSSKKGSPPEGLSRGASEERQGGWKTMNFTFAIKQGERVLSTESFRGIWPDAKRRLKEIEDELGPGMKVEVVK